MTSIPPGSSVSPHPQQQTSLLSASLQSTAKQQTTDSSNTSQPVDNVKQALNGQTPAIMATTAAGQAPQQQHNPALVNGTPQGEHGRKSSLNAAAAGGWLPNANGSRNSIQFGSLGGSPAPVNSIPQGLAPGNHNPRINSPSSSPSPIPQPIPGGGRPPSGLQGANMTFGSLPGSESPESARARPYSMPPQGPNQGHLRRDSSQSVQSDMSNPGMPMGRGYPQGRGRGGYQQQPYQMQNNYNQGYRPNQPRNGPIPGQYPPGQMQYAGSPRHSGRSPAMAPVTPNMQQAQMVNPQMHPYQQYPQMPQQGYNMHGQIDPNFYPQQYMPQMYPYNPPSPRTPYQTIQTPHYGYAPAAPPISRSSSQMSEQRPTLAAQAPPPSQSPNPITNTKPNFTLQPRRSAAIQIKDEKGNVVVPTNAKLSQPGSTTSTPPPVEKEKPVVKAEPKSTLSAEEKKAAAKEAIREKLEAEERKKAEEKAASDKAAQEAEDKEAAEKAAAEKAAAEKEASEKAAKEAEEKEAAEKKAEAEAAEKAAAESSSSASSGTKSPSDDGDEKDADKDEAADPKVANALATSLEKLALDPSSRNSSQDSMAPPARPDSKKRGSLHVVTQPAEPTKAFFSLQNAKPIESITATKYPEGVSAPTASLNAADSTKFKYNIEFLLQFQDLYKDKPSADWEQKLAASIGDTAESARGPGSARPSASRAGSTNRVPTAFAQFGAFSAGKTLPPGTTSAERFAMSNQAMQRGMGGSSSQRGGYNTPPLMNRQGSSTNLAGQPPQSPRSGNRSQRARGDGSKRGLDKSGRNDEKEAKAMPLTANMEIKPLVVSTTGWKPRSLAATATGNAGPTPGGGPTMLDPEAVQRKVKANLNKMTPEKFDKIADQILEIASQSKHESDGRTLRQVIQLTFEKATDESHFSSMYAKFAKRMLESIDPSIKDESIKDKHGNVVTGGALFRKYLLNRCQEEFERGWKVNLPPKPEGDSEEAVLLSDEYYVAAAAKRRGLGLVQFIGELYKLNMLTERIMLECVRKLVDFEDTPDEAEVESLCKLLRTIGKNLDSAEKAKPFMDAYFQRIDVMLATKLPSRFKFMLMDVIDLRKHRWESKDADKGPKTIQEIREEAVRVAAEKEAEKARSQSQRGRPGGGRGDARSFSSGQYGLMQPPEHTRQTVANDDLRKLSNLRKTTAGGPQSFGPSSMLNNRSNSRRGLGPNLSRNSEDSGPNSRTATPPAAAAANMFSALMNHEAGDANEAASPPSSVSSPQPAAAKLDIDSSKSAADAEDKE